MTHSPDKIATQLPRDPLCTGALFGNILKVLPSPVQGRQGESLAEGSHVQRLQREILYLLFLVSCGALESVEGQNEVLLGLTQPPFLLYLSGH